MLFVLTVSSALEAAPSEREARAITAQVAAELNSFQPRSAVDLLTAQARLDGATRLAPWYGPAYRISGELKLEQADYFGATSAFNAALGQDPYDREARRGLAEAVRLSWLVMNFPLAYPQQVLRLVEVPEQGRPGAFLVIGAAVYWGPDLTGVQLRLQSPEVRYYVWRDRGYQETFRRQGIGDGLQSVVAGSGAPATQVAGLGTPALQPTFARAWADDFQRTGRFQVFLVTGWVGRDSVPTSADVFETAEGSLRQVLHADSSFPPELVDLDGDGRFEVRTEQRVGVTMPRVEMGEWFDLYGYDGWQYVRANELYPAFAGEQLLRMLDLEAKYPADPQVRERVVQAYRDAGY
jgi:hypothetical protein